jgi:hypothetical protein
VDGTIKIAHRSSAEEERNNRATEATPPEGGTGGHTRTKSKRWGSLVLNKGVEPPMMF